MRTTYIWHILNPPIFEANEEKTRLAGLLYYIFLGTVVLAILLCLAALVDSQPLRLAIPALWLPVGVGGLFLVRRGWVGLARVSFLLITWLLLTLVALVSGGVHTPAFASYTVVILMAGLLCRTYSGVIFAGLSAAAGFGFVYAEANGLLPAPLIETTAISTWIGLTADFLAIVVLVYLTIRSLSEALERARRNEAALQASNHELETRTAELAQLNEQFAYQIDRHRQTLAALRQSEENFRALADNASDGIMIATAENGNIAYANLGAAAMIGYLSPGQLLGMTLKELVHPDEYDRVSQQYRQRLAGEIVPSLYETMLLHTDGRAVPVEAATARTMWHGRQASLILVREITARKQTEEALRQAEKRYRELFEEAPAMYVITRNQAGAPLVVDCNQLFLGTLKYSRAEVVGRPLAHLYSPESEAALLDGGYQRALTGSFEAEERQLVTRDGRIIETLLRARPEIGPDGQVTGTRAMYVDIRERKQIEQELDNYRQHLEELVAERTAALVKANQQLQQEVSERKQAEEALRESEELARRTFDQSPIGAAMVSLDYRFLRVNQQLCQILGYSEAELLALSFPDITHPDDLAVDVEQAERLVANEIDQYAMDKRYIRKDGQTVWMHLSVRLIRDAANRPLYFLPMMRNITARKRAEEALRQNEARYRAIVENTHDIIYTHDPEGRITFVSPSVARLGYAPDDVLGRHLIEFIYPDDVEQVVANFERTVQTKQEFPSVFRLVTRMGEVIHVEEAGKPQLDENGQLIQLTGVIRDVTERARIESALRESESNYRQLVEILQEGIWRIDGEGVTTYANPRMADMLGYTVAEMQGKSLFSFMDEANVENARRYIEHRAQGIQERYDFEFLRKDKTRLYASLATTPLTDDKGNYIGALAAVVDITERRQTEEILQQRNRELILLNRASRAFSATLNLDQVLAIILDEMQHMLRITASSFWMITPETGELICRQAVGPGKDVAMSWRLQPGQGLAGWVATSGQPLIVQDTAAETRHFKGVDQQIGLEMRSIISIPLKAQNQVIGVLNLVDTAPGRFTTNDLMLLEPLVASAAIAIENARLHAAVQAELDVRRRTEEALRHLNEVLEQRIEERTQALRQSEEMFRSLAENIREVFWVRDCERMLYISPAYEEVWGRSCDSVYRQPTSFTDSIAPDDRDRAVTALTDIGRQLSSDQEYRIIQPDGALRWVRARSFPVKKDDGSIQSVGIAEDITARKHMEERLATIYQLGQELTLLRDTSGILEQALQVAVRILRVEVAGCGLVDEAGTKLTYHYRAGGRPDLYKVDLPLAGDETQSASQAVILSRLPIYVPDTLQDPDHMSLLSDAQVRSELVVPMQVGESVMGLLHTGSASPHYFTPADQQLLQTLADQTAVALENARLYDKLQQNVEELTWLNLENARLYAAEQSRYREAEALRRAALALTSTIDPGELLNRMLTELQSVIPYNSASVMLLKDGYLEIIAGQGFDDLSTVIGVCVPLYREFSPDYQVITSLQPLIIADTHSGSITLAEISPGTARIRSWLGVPLIARDYPLGIITLDKYEANFYTETHAQTAQAYAAQAAIALDNARLYQDLQNRMEALRAAQSQLVQSERMAALGRLMASIAHEINNPLQGVQGFLSLLDEELNYRRRQEKIDFYLKIAGQEIERISHIVHRMREFYRPASYQLPATLDSLNGFYHLAGEDFQDIDLHDTLESVLQLANKKLQHNRIVVERVWEPQLPPVPASLDYLKQVFLNLTLNAIDAMQTEGGTLRVSTALDQALLSGDQPQQVVRIEFSDNGVGIPPEVQARLFEPLISTKEHGTGFGLFTSYQIVAAHHGQITVTSSAGAGTTFIILLPLEQPAA